MRTAYAAGCWLVFRYDLERPQPTLDDQLLMADASVLDGFAARGRRHAQPFLIDPDGRPDARVNAFFASARMLSRSSLKWCNYAQSDPILRRAVAEQAPDHITPDTEVLALELGGVPLRPRARVCHPVSR